MAQTTPVSDPGDLLEKLVREQSIKLEPLLPKGLRDGRNVGGTMCFPAWRCTQSTVLSTPRTDRSGQVLPCPLLRPDAAQRAYRPCVETMRDPYGEHSRGAMPDSTH